MIKRTEAPYKPYVSQWADWDPPGYVFAIEPGQVVGYHRRNGEIATLLKVVVE